MLAYRDQMEHNPEIGILFRYSQQPNCGQPGRGNAAKEAIGGYDAAPRVVSGISWSAYWV